MDLMHIVDVVMEITHKMLIAGSAGTLMWAAALMWGCMRHP